MRRPRASSSSRARSHDGKERERSAVGTNVTETAPSWLDRFREESSRIPVPPMFRPAPGARAAAVLILFGEGPDGPDVLLTERAATLKKHAGQPAFPAAASTRRTTARSRRRCARRGRRPLSNRPKRGRPLHVARAVPVAQRAPGHARRRLVAGAVGHRARPPGEVATVARVPLDELVDPGNRVMVRHPSGIRMGAFRVRDMLVWGSRPRCSPRSWTRGLEPAVGHVSDRGPAARGAGPRRPGLRIS